MKFKCSLPYSHDTRAQITEANPTPNPSPIEIESPIISVEDLEGKSLLNPSFEVVVAHCIDKGLPHNPGLPK